MSFGPERAKKKSFLSSQNFCRCLLWVGETLLFCSLAAFLINAVNNCILSPCRRLGSVVLFYLFLHPRLCLWWVIQFRQKFAKASTSNLIKMSIYHQTEQAIHYMDVSIYLALQTCHFVRYKFDFTHGQKQPWKWQLSDILFPNRIKETVDGGLSVESKRKLRQVPKQVRETCKELKRGEKIMKNIG